MARKWSRRHAGDSLPSDDTPLPCNLDSAQLTRHHDDYDDDDDDDDYDDDRKEKGDDDGDDDAEALITTMTMTMANDEDG